MSRALTRHHHQRMKQRRSGYFTAGDQSARSVGIVASTAKPCSCWKCRNKRQEEGKTLQEHRSALSFREHMAG
jgi:hypothetical protein